MDINNCILIIDKPPGQTSHETTTLVKKITGASRSGHAGTLDPEVSGVLPVALGKATKLLRYIAGKEKTYVGLVKFRKIMSKEEIERLFSQFTGELIQTPPKISAVRKVARKRHVYYIKLLEKHERLVLFETRVDAGTYIRTLCEDMGKKCGGARMEELRRIAVGDIRENQTHSMQELVDAVWFKKNDPSLLESMMIKPEFLIDLPKVFVKEAVIKSIISGAQIMAPGIESMENVTKGMKVAIYSRDKFVGVGVSEIDSKELLEKKNGMVVKIERIHFQE